MPQIPAWETLQGFVYEEAERVKYEVTDAHRSWDLINKAARVLLIIYVIQLALFALLAWWIHIHPINSIDLAITREFQENPASWLRISMIVVSYPGFWYILVPLVALAALACWLIGLRLEAVFIVGLPLISGGVNTLVKYLVERPRPNGHLVNVFQAASGQSFPSGHVMAYLAFWGLLFSFGIMLFRGARWWRILLLVVSALLVVLIGPSRVYLGDHWASDVLGAYLIGGALLGLALYLYLQLKQRGILETRHIQEQINRSHVLRPFPRKEG